MSEQRLLSNIWKRSLWILPPLLIGIAVVFIASFIKTPPQKMAVTERAVKVRAFTVANLDVVTHAVGFGKITPARTWEAAAEIPGQIAWVSDDLRDGRIVTSGTELLRIEDANYRLTLTQAEAQIRASEVKNKISRDGLAISEKNYDLLRSEFDRQKKLAANGTISKAALENTERQMLVGQTQVKTLENTLLLNTAEHQVLIAQRDAAALDLERTHKAAPFNVRITAVNIGVAQYANKGQLLFTADGLDVAEVEAQFAVGSLRPLISRPGKETALDVRQGVLSLSAVVRLRTATHMVEWPARVDRVSGTIDPQTQSLGVIVAIDRPYDAAMPGKRPPLLRNTFVDVELIAPALEGQIVVPTNAVRDGEVYVVNPDSRLERRKVKVAFSQQGYTVIQEGLNPGERIVLSDLMSAVNGMLLAPQEDEESRRRMKLAATNEAPKK